MEILRKKELREYEFHILLPSTCIAFHFYVLVQQTPHSFSRSQIILLYNFFRSFLSNIFSCCHLLCLYGEMAQNCLRYWWCCMKRRIKAYPKNLQAVLIQPLWIACHNRVCSRCSEHAFAEAHIGIYTSLSIIRHTHTECKTWMYDVRLSVNVVLTLSYMLAKSNAYASRLVWQSMGMGCRMVDGEIGGENGERTRMEWVKVSERGVAAYGI